MTYKIMQEKDGKWSVVECENIEQGKLLLVRRLFSSPTKKRLHRIIKELYLESKR